VGGLIVAVIGSLVMGGVVFTLTSLRSEGSGYDREISLKPRKASVFLGLLVAALLFGIIWVCASYVQVERGTVAVVTHFGAVTGEVFQPGLHWKHPFFESVVVLRTQKITYETSEFPEQSQATYTDYQVDTTTQDGQRITVRYTVRFRIDSSRAAWVAENLGSEVDVVEKVIKTDSRIHVRNAARDFEAAQLYTGNVEEYQVAVSARLQPVFEENGIILDEFGVRSILFEEDYAEAVEQKQIAFEGIATAQYEAQQEEHRKQATITRAEAEAERLRIEASGTAEALRLKGEALRENPNVLQLQYIETLAPSVRVILIPSDSPYILGEGVLEGLTP
jgi:prohibitin 2